ncbi:MAG: hypothetical protein WC682_04740 [Parcubacteria group bacterium]|jgi:hypothetical protein
MNAPISNLKYFSIICLQDKSQNLEDIYRANYFSIKRSSIFEKATKLEEFANAFCVQVEGWIADLRFCSEEFDFIIRFPCLSSDTKKACLNSNRPVIIMRTEDSDEDACRVVVDKFIDIFWMEFCAYPMRKRNIGRTPNEILFYKKDGMKKIPKWYLPPAAFFHHLKHKEADPISCWLAAENEMLSQGLQFV